MEKLESRPFGEGDVDPVAAIDAPAAALDRVRLVELQLGASVRASEVWFFGREFATRNDFDEVVLALPCRIGDPEEYLRPVGIDRDFRVGARQTRIAICVNGPAWVARATCSARAASGSNMTSVHEPTSSVVTSRSLIVPDTSSHRVRTPAGSFFSAGSDRLALGKVVAVPVRGLVGRRSR